MAAVRTPVRGAVNVAARGTIGLSRMIRLAGRLPLPLAVAAVRAAHRARALGWRLLGGLPAPAALRARGGRRAPGARGRATGPALERAEAVEDWVTRARVREAARERAPERGRRPRLSCGGCARGSTPASSCPTRSAAAAARCRATRASRPSASCAASRATTRRTSGASTRTSPTLVEPLFALPLRALVARAVEGAHNVPGHGRALLVANHAGILPWDATMIATALLREHPLPRHPRFLVLNWAFDLPWISVFMRASAAWWPRPTTRCGCSSRTSWWPCSPRASRAPASRSPSATACSASAAAASSRSPCARARRSCRWPWWAARRSIPSSASCPRWRA